MILNLKNEFKKNKIDELNPEQIGKLFPIKIVPYNSEWEKLFEQEKTLITKTLSEKSILSIEHIGSTSVVGLASKPTIDIMVEVLNLNNKIKQIITDKLKTIGYKNMYNSEQENKMTFGKGYDENYSCKNTYHLHVRKKGTTLPDEIYFRDYLQQNSNICDEYSKLKYELAEKYQFNRENYTQAKTDFIKKITELQKRKTRLNKK